MKPFALIKGIEADLKTPRLHCATDHDDLEFVIDHIKKQYPTSHILAIGISLGSYSYYTHAHFMKVYPKKSQSKQDPKVSNSGFSDQNWETFSLTTNVYKELILVVYLLKRRLPAWRLFSKQRTQLRYFQRLDYFDIFQ